MVGGVAVANGSTLSATGEMQVTCNAPYVLTVDGVEWVPTASAGGVDTYLLSTSGVVRIFINGTRYFYFKNVITADFSIPAFSLDQRVGDNIVKSENVSGYFQGQLESGVNRLTFTFNINNVSPNMTREDMVAFGASCNQGIVDIGPASWDENLVYVEITRFDQTTYNAVFVGNVLIAFIEPR